MNAMVFDSHEAALAYKDAGFTDAQVEPLLAVNRKTTSLPDVAALATRDDVNKKVDALEAKLTGAIENAKFQMLTSVIVAMGGLTAIVLAIAKLVH